MCDHSYVVVSPEALAGQRQNSCLHTPMRHTVVYVVICSPVCGMARQARCDESVVESVVRLSQLQSEMCLNINA